METDQWGYVSQEGMSCGNHNKKNHNNINNKNHNKNDNHNKKNSINSIPIIP